MENIRQQHQEVKTLRTDKYHAFCKTNFREGGFLSYNYDVKEYKAEHL
jgi:hypothetical protein